MELSLKKYLLAGTMLAGVAAFGGATPALAGNTCAPVGRASAGCDLVITLNSNGTATVSNGPSSGLSGGTYDGSDDVLVGVVNNSGGNVNAIKLNGGTNAIFAFDGDGISVNPNPVSGLPGLAIPGDTGPSHGGGYSGTDSTTANFNLAGPLNSFSGITGSQRVGIVNFAGGLASGGSAFFGLELPLTASSFTATTAVPEPASLTLFGAALAGFGLMRRRRKNPT